MNDHRFRLAGSTIRFKNGVVFVINYRVVDMPVTFEKRGRRFRPAWGPYDLRQPENSPSGRPVKSQGRSPTRANGTRPLGE